MASFFDDCELLFFFLVRMNCGRDDCWREENLNESVDEPPPPPFIDDLPEPDARFNRKLSSICFCKVRLRSMNICVNLNRCSSNSFISWCNIFASRRSNSAIAFAFRISFRISNWTLFGVRFTSFRADALSIACSKASNDDELIGNVLRSHELLEVVCGLLIEVILFTNELYGVVGVSFPQSCAPKNEKPENRIDIFAKWEIAGNRMPFQILLPFWSFSVDGRSHF